MIDLDQRAEALAKKGLERSASDKQAAADQRKAAWEKIQSTDPVLAKFMTDFNAVFGKPAAIKVEINGETVINQGEPTPARKFYDGKLRQLPGGYR
jgi:hypothetical protein